MTRHELPEGWDWKKLSDKKLVYIEMGQSPPSRTYNNVGQGLPFYQGKAEFGELYPTTVKWCSEPSKIAVRDDVLISVRAPVGPVNLCQEKSCIGRGLAALRALERLSHIYLFFYLRVSEQELASQGAGSTFSAITKTQLREFPIPLPPLEEQRQIVAILEQAEELRRLRLEADRLTEKILPSAFIEMFGDPRENPKGWAMVKLGEIAGVRSGNPAPQGSQYFQGGEYPFVRVQDLGRYGKTLSLTETADKVNDLAVRECRLSLVPAGSILFPKSGMSTLLNHRALLALDAYVVSHLAIVTPKTSVLEKWLYFYFYFLDAGQWAQRTTLPSLRLSTIKGFDVPLPPLEEQQRFVELVEELQANEERQTEARRFLNELCQSLTARAFTGELTAHWREEQKAFVAERQAVILALLSGLKRRAIQPVLITALMKFLFLIQTEGGTREFYKFIPYKYGPFAKEVYDDLDTLRDKGLVDVSSIADNGARERTEISVSPEREQEVRQSILELESAIQQKVGAIIDSYGKLSLNDLLDHVYADYPEYTLRSER